MAHSHFVMDLHYQEVRDPDRYRREVLRIEAIDDAAAEAEGRRIDAWRKPAFFVVRAIETPKGRERLIFDSRSEQAAPVEDAPAPETVTDLPQETQAATIPLAAEAVSE
jgi:hypothetical protein